MISRRVGLVADEAWVGPRSGTPGVSAASMLLGQIRYANRGFWRTPVAAFFTLVFPLSFLVILSAIFGNSVVDPATGLTLAQYTTPVFAVFGTCMACYMSLAIAVAYARQSGVLKRMRGTPLPPGLHIAGRIVSSIWVSVIAVGVMLGTGVVFYGVQIIWANVPALLLTFLVGASCFAALGLAVAAVAPTPSATTAFGNASLIVLSFISGIFGFGQLPAWMDRLASVFPLKPFVDSFAAGFNPYIDAATPDWGKLAVLVAWGLGGAVVVRRALTWEPKAARKPRTKGNQHREGSPGRADEVVRTPVAAGTAPPRIPTVHEARPPGLSRLVAWQARYAMTQAIRDPMSMFFAILFPVLLVSFFSAVIGDEAQWAGLPLPQYLAAAFAVYGVATSAFVNLAGSVADQRSQRVLKRIRGTPLPSWAYMAGRLVATLLLGLLTVGLVFAVAVVFFAATLPPSTWLVTLLTFVLAITCFAACGMALVAVVDSPQAVIATTLSVLLPLSFISDIFIAVDSMPPLLNAIGWAMPLRHAVAAAVTASSGGALDATFWGHIGMLALWASATALAARHWFHWEPRAVGAGRHHRVPSGRQGATSGRARP